MEAVHKGEDDVEEAEDYPDDGVHDFPQVAEALAEVGEGFVDSSIRRAITIISRTARDTCQTTIRLRATIIKSIRRKIHFKTVISKTLRT
jgi:hypothetical protein